VCESGREVNRKSQIILLIVWIVVIFVLTGYPGLKSPRIKDVPVDKLYHFIAFFLLGIFEIRVMKPVMFFTVGTTVALLAEFQQLIIPGRDFEWMDIIAGIFGLIIVFLFGRRRELVKNGVSKT